MAGKDHSFIGNPSPTAKARLLHKGDTGTLLLEVLHPHGASRTEGGRKQTAIPGHATHLIFPAHTEETKEVC